MTVREIAAGTLIGWSLVVVFVACELWLGALSTLTRGIAIATLLVPTAALAAALGLLSQLAPIICVAVVVFGRSHPIVAEALQDALGSRAVFFARANGLSAPRRFFSTALSVVMPELIATIGLSLNVAIGAVIAAEAVCDRPGLGRLAIEASLARDPRVVVLLSMLICGVTLLANAKHTERIHAEALR